MRKGCYHGHKKVACIPIKGMRKTTSHYGIWRLECNPSTILEWFVPHFIQTFYLIYNFACCVREYIEVLKPRSWEPISRSWNPGPESVYCTSLCKNMAAATEEESREE
jgi:hypothetical protein